MRRFGHILCTLILLMFLGGEYVCGQNMKIEKGWGDAIIDGPISCGDIEYFYITNGNSWCNYKCIVDDVNVSDTYSKVDDDNIWSGGCENGGLKVKEISTFYVIINPSEEKIVLSVSEPSCGPSITISAPNVRLHEGDIFELSPVIQQSDIPSNYSVSYQWYKDNIELQDSTGESIYVNSDVIGSYVYKITAVILDENGDTVNSTYCESIINVLDASAPLWPVCYNLKKTDDSDFQICTDEYGNIDINLEESIYNDIGVLTIPTDMTIECNSFKIRGYGNGVGTNVGILCKGKILCDSIFHISNLGYCNEQPYFLSECTSTIQSPKINVGYVYTIQPFYGNWLTDSLIVSNGNGQDVNFPSCSFTRTHYLNINANISNKVLIAGHVISDKVIATRDLHLEYTGTENDEAILTIGDLEGVYGNIMITADEYTTVNMCVNPNVGDGTIENEGEWNQHPNGADNIGYFNGSILYNIDEKGWSMENYGPDSEWDINYPTSDGRYSGYSAKFVIPIYESYDDCMNEIPSVKFLGIDEYSTKGTKEIKPLYAPFNPCHEDFYNNRIKIRELGNKYFRYINGELFYCENDN